MATTADIRNGMILKIDDGLYSVIEFGQIKLPERQLKFGQD